MAMTVVAIGHGPPNSFNLLLADTTVGTAKGPCDRQKIIRLGGDEFCTVVGDEQVRDAPTRSSRCRAWLRTLAPL
jgi:hypothetical protein